MRFVVLGRVIKWMTGDGWFWRRGLWYLSPVLLFAVAVAVGIVQDTTGINVLDETARLVALAIERSQPVTLALCGAALAAGLLGLTVVVPRVLTAPDVDAAREQLETAAVGLMFTVWAAVFAFVFQWMFAALSDDLQLARVILG